MCSLPSRMPGRRAYVPRGAALVPSEDDNPPALVLERSQPLVLRIGERFNPWRAFTGIFVPDALLANRHVSPGSKLCYGRLMRYAGERGYAWPSRETLARDLGVSIERIKHYIRELRDERLIETERGSQPYGTNRFYFLWHEIFDLRAPLSPDPSLFSIDSQTDRSIDRSN